MTGLASGAQPAGQSPGPGPGRCARLTSQIQASADIQRARRREQGQPWAVRKLAVFLAFGILGYTYYVYTVRFCIKMIQKRFDAAGSRAQGIAYTVVFNILFLFLLWAYARIIFTSPGFARDHVSTCPPPEPRFSSPYGPNDGSVYSGSMSMRAGPRYTPSSGPRMGSPDVASASSPPNITSDDRVEAEVARSSQGKQEPNREASSPMESAAQAYARSYVESLHVVSDGHAEFPQNRAMSGLSVDANPVRNDVELGAIPGAHGASRPNGDTGTSWRRPKYRYCSYDEIVKPPRTHHCRICGTCVLMFDHHCPWVGQCVGARNRRFFFIFCLYSTIFCLWTAVTLIVGVATNAFDGQFIAIIVLALLFMGFTATMTWTHGCLILMNVTTVEQLGIQNMQRKESASLDSVFPSWDIRGKRRKVREWDAEWGRIGREGNLWWLGTWRANWESMMGPGPLYWFFPIGSSVNDGLSFPTNPRFDVEGRWRPRSEWPAELR